MTVLHMSKHEAARYEGSCRIAHWPLEEATRGLMLDKSAVMQKNDIVRKPSRLAHVVGNDNHFDATMFGVDKEPLDGERRRGIKTCGWLIEKEHFWIEAQGSSKAEPLLFAAGKDPCGCERMMMQSGQLQSLQSPRGTFAPRKTTQAKRVSDVGGCGPAEQHRLLEHHGLAEPDLVIHWRIAPKNDTFGWLD
jgi:hypothetical protein